MSEDEDRARRYASRLARDPRFLERVAVVEEEIRAKGRRDR